MKKSAVTGEDVPDDSKRLPLERHVNPRKAAWPEADFVVGNPPFIGAKYIRDAPGDGYAGALRATWTEVPESADFVMYWWHHAAMLTKHGAPQRFGFITTSSIRQTFNRRVIEAALLPSPSGRRAGDEGTVSANHLAPPAPSSVAAHHLLPKREGKVQPLSLVFAIPDHPWVDATDGAAVRIAMTVGASGSTDGQLRVVENEADGEQDEVAVTPRSRIGVIHVPRHRHLARRRIDLHRDFGCVMSRRSI